MSVQSYEHSMILPLYGASFFLPFFLSFSSALCLHVCFPFHENQFIDNFSIQALLQQSPVCFLISQNFMHDFSLIMPMFIHPIYLVFIYICVFRFSVVSLIIFSFSFALSSSLSLFHFYSNGIHKTFSFRRMSTDSCEEKTKPNRGINKQTEIKYY